MVAAEHQPKAVEFAVVRRGYDAQQVTDHLERLAVETEILVGDRAAAVEQATQLDRELDGTRGELAAARSEIERLRTELRVLSGPTINVENMDERLQVVLRLAHDEFGGTRAAVAADVAEVIAAAAQESGQVVGGTTSPAANGNGWRSPEAEREIDRFRREEAAERTRLDEAAADRRAKEDEEFRNTLALRCREALAQVSRLQAESLRSAQQMLADADHQVRAQLEHARTTAGGMIGAAQREVDELHVLREQLTRQLDTTRELLDRARPTVPATPAGTDGVGGGAVKALDAAEAGRPEPVDDEGADPEPTVPGPSAVPAVEHVPSSAPTHSQLEGVTRVASAGRDEDRLAGGHQGH